MNKHGIALAADSAVTIGRGDEDAKIFPSANKIFALSKYEPVAIMVYGNAELLGRSWETIVKLYRRELSDKSFPTVHDYVLDFVRFVGGSEWLFPESSQARYVRDYAGQVLRAIAAQVREEVKKHIDEQGTIDDEVVETIVTSEVGYWSAIWGDAAELPFVTAGHHQAVKDVYGDEIDDLIASVFESVAMDTDTLEQVRELALQLLTHVPALDLPSVTGIVIAGFGTDDLCPMLEELRADGVAAGELLAWGGRRGEVNEDNNAYVSAFAQGEMVSRFMEGVDPAYQGTIEDSVSKIMEGYTDALVKKLGRRPSKAVLGELAEARREMLEEFSARLEQHRQLSYVANVIDVVGVLPLEELAHMAESLVNLTSFKRRVSMETESVGGPIDVAVISRGDGFIWIRRKHYFEQSLNPHFLANYYK